MSDSCSPRKLEAGFDGMYLMSSFLMTSTMKSEPATPPMRGNSFGGRVSAAATRMVGGSADGTRGSTEALDAEVAVACGDATAVAAPVTAAAARNPRRLTLERACFGVLLSRAMWLSPCSQGAAIVLLPGHGSIEGYYRCR